MADSADKPERNQSFDYWREKEAASRREQEEAEAAKQQAKEMSDAADKASAAEAPPPEEDAPAADKPKEESDSGPNEETIEETFSFFDANGDGSISFQEMEYVVLLLGGDQSRDHLDKLWDIVDTDADASRISKTEFKTAWQNKEVREKFSKPGSEGTSWPHTDVGEMGNFVVVKMDIPGLIKESLQIQFHGTFLLVVGERPIKAFDVVHESKSGLPGRHNGKFARLVDIPVPVSKKRIHHNYKNGVLKIKIKKKKDRGAFDSSVAVSFKHPGASEEPKAEPEGKTDPAQSQTEAKPEASADEQ